MIKNIVFDFGNVIIKWNILNPKNGCRWMKEA